MSDSLKLHKQTSRIRPFRGPGQADEYLGGGAGDDGSADNQRGERGDIGDAADEVSGDDGADARSRARPGRARMARNALSSRRARVSGFLASANASTYSRWWV